MSNSDEDYGVITRYQSREWMASESVCRMFLTRRVECKENMNTYTREIYYDTCMYCIMALNIDYVKAIMRFLREKARSCCNCQCSGCSIIFSPG